MEKLKGNRKISSGSTPYNQLDFFVQNLIKATVNTALPVKVVNVYSNGVGKTGYVDIIPLTQSYDGFGNAILAQTIFKVPYCRIQGGIASLIIDPVVGDIGIAVFAQQDITNISNTPQKPFSKRCFSMADALYIGGILNQEPTIYLELTQNNEANLIAPLSVNIKTKAMTIDCESMKVNANTINMKANSVTIDSPATTITGNLTTGTNGNGGNVSMTGQVKIKGGLSATQDVTASGISLNSHTHTCPDGDTSSPI